jgi:hypothetical protein
MVGVFALGVGAGLPSSLDNYQIPCYNQGIGENQMEKEIAIQLGTILLNGLVQFWEDLYSPEMEDFDWWYGIASGWDINVFWSDANKRLEGTVYPVDKDGNTVTLIGYDLPLDN